MGDDASSARLRSAGSLVGEALQTASSHLKMGDLYVRVCCGVTIALLQFCLYIALLQFSLYSELAMQIQ